MAETKKPPYVGGLVSALFDIRKLNPQDESEFKRRDDARAFINWFKVNDPEALKKAEEQYKKQFPSLGTKLISKGTQLINKLRGKQYGGEIKRYAQPRKVNAKYDG